MSLVDKIKEGIAIVSATAIFSAGIVGVSAFLDYRHYTLHVIGLNTGLGKKYELDFWDYTDYYLQNFDVTKTWLDQGNDYICKKGEKQFCREKR